MSVCIFFCPLNYRRVSSNCQAAVAWNSYENMMTIWNNTKIPSSKSNLKPQSADSQDGANGGNRINGESMADNIAMRKSTFVSAYSSRKSRTKWIYLPWMQWMPLCFYRCHEWLEMKLLSAFSHEHKGSTASPQIHQLWSIGVTLFTHCISQLYGNKHT